MITADGFNYIDDMKGVWLNGKNRLMDLRGLMQEKQKKSTAHRLDSGFKKSSYNYITNMRRTID